MRRPTTERTLSGLSNASSVGNARQWVPSWTRAPVSTKWRHSSPSRNGLPSVCWASTSIARAGTASTVVPDAASTNAATP